jgi:hypothetical protein
VPLLLVSAQPVGAGVTSLSRVRLDPGANHGVMSGGAAASRNPEGRPAASKSGAKGNGSSVRSGFLRPSLDSRWRRGRRRERTRL